MINDGTVTINTCLSGQIFKHYHIKIVSTVPDSSAVFSAILEAQGSFFCWKAPNLSPK